MMPVWSLDTSLGLSKFFRCSQSFFPRAKAGKGAVPREIQNLGLSYKIEINVERHVSSFANSTNWIH